MKFGENLYNLRKSAKMSQEKLAEKMEVSRQSVSKWENGDSYPEMEKIIRLCNIFHCKINDLVHEEISDIDSLDEDIKMSVVKFRKEKQKKMKGISKIIYIIARIGKIIILITAIALALSMAVIPMIANKIEISDTQIKFFGETCEYKVEDKTITLTAEKTGKTRELYIDTNSNLKDYFTNHSITYYLVTGECIGLCLLAFIVIIFNILKYIEKLFLNIHNEDTPFNMENVNSIRKIAILLIIAIIGPIIGGLIFQAILKIDMNISIELMDVMLILIIFSLVYVFEYGYEIQVDSKGKMYGDEK